MQIHSAWCTGLPFAGTGSGWIILQIMYFPCFTFPMNPLLAYTLWVWGCSWPPHVDQRFPLLKACCCWLASDCSKSHHTNFQAFCSPHNISVLPAVTCWWCWAVPLPGWTTALPEACCTVELSKSPPYVLCKRKHYFWHNVLRQEPIATRIQMQDLPEQT